jgi:hypothetical protein
VRALEGMQKAEPGLNGCLRVIVSDCTGSQPGVLHSAAVCGVAGQQLQSARALLPAEL